MGRVITGKRAQEWRAIQCRGKARYATWGLASRVIKRMLRNGERGLDVYRCRFCKGWHIGGTESQKGR